MLISSVGTGEGVSSSQKILSLSDKDVIAAVKEERTP